MGLDHNQPDNQSSGNNISEGPAYSHGLELNQNVAIAIAGPAMPDREHHGYLNQVYKTNFDLITLMFCNTIYIVKFNQYIFRIIGKLHYRVKQRGICCVVSYGFLKLWIKMP